MLVQRWTFNVIYDQVCTSRNIAETLKFSATNTRPIFDVRVWSISSANFLCDWDLAATSNIYCNVLPISDVAATLQFCRNQSSTSLFNNFQHHCNVAWTSYVYRDFLPIFDVAATFHRHQNLVKIVDQSLKSQLRCSFVWNFDQLWAWQRHQYYVQIWSKFLTSFRCQCNLGATLHTYLNFDQFSKSQQRRHWSNFTAM